MSDVHPLLNIDVIRQALRFPEVVIDYFDCLDSTNSYLQGFSDHSIRVCLAEVQTSARGRLGRGWYSPKQQNIYCSLRYPSLSAEQCESLSLLSAVSVCRAIESLVPLSYPLKIKWPNDIYCDGSKLAGILVESRVRAQHTFDVVIGIGLNVNMKTADIARDWTSLCQITSQAYQRDLLCASMINELVGDIKRQALASEPIWTREWLARDYLLGQTIVVQQDAMPVAGEVLGVTSCGHLRLLLASGEEKIIASGEATIKSFV